MQWNVGKVKVTKIVELETVGSTRFILPLATNDEIQKLPWLVPHFATAEGRLKMSIHSLVLETPTRRIVVDTGLGNDGEGRKVPTWNNRKDPFRNHDGGRLSCPTASTRSFARICMSTTSAGIQKNWLAANGADLRQRPLRVVLAKPN
jgi:hypothetical protein